MLGKVLGVLMLILGVAILAFCFVAIFSEIGFLPWYIWVIGFGCLIVGLIAIAN